MPDPSRLQLPIASLLLILLFSPIILRSEEENSDRLTVFCTSNKDGTGACMTTSQDPVDCILVPGSIVDCNDKHKNEQEKEDIALKQYEYQIFLLLM